MASKGGNNGGNRHIHFYPMIGARVKGIGVNRVAATRSLRSGAREVTALHSEDTASRLHTYFIAPHASSASTQNAVPAFVM